MLKKLIVKNNAPFRSYITQIKNTLIDNTKDLNIVMSVYNLVKYSRNYSVTSRTFQNYYRDELNDDENENANNIINQNGTIISKSFEQKIKIVRRRSSDNDELDTEVIVPLKYLIKFLQISRFVID